MTAPKLRVRSSGHGGSGYKHPLTGAVVPGVTTVLKRLDKPALLQWAVDNTAAFAVSNIDALLNRTEEQGYGFLRWYWKRDALDGDRTDIRNASNGILNDAAELGTMLHDWAAADHGFGSYPDTSNAPPYFWELVAQWDLFNQEHDVQPILTETTLWSHCYGYAGTCDGLWLIDGVPTLLDIKTSRNTWDEHRMQLAALGACETMLREVTEDHWIEEPIPAFSQYMLLQIRPSDFDKHGATMEPYYKLHVIDPLELDQLFDQFLGLLQVSHAQNKLKEIRKSVLDSSIGGE